jgi:hypothetical protein
MAELPAVEALVPGNEGWAAMLDQEADKAVVSDAFLTNIATDQ